MKLYATWTGGKKLDRLTKEWTKNAILGVNKATIRVERQIKINVVKGGAFRRAKGRPWVPNPGKHLRRGDGTLVNSWRSTPAQVVGKNVEGHVSTWVPYAAIHEFGGTITFGARTFLRRSRDGKISQGRSSGGWTVRMPERPYVRPAVKHTSELVVKDIKDAVMAPAK